MDSVPRKGTVTQIDGLGRVALVYADSHIGGPPLARPFVGGASSGFHSAPQQGDQLLVHHEHPWRPAAVTSVAVHPESLTPLNPGESAIYHPDGRVLSYVKNDGTTTIWSKPGKPSTTVDANGVWNLGGLAGVATLDANSHVQQQAVYDATEAQTNDTLGSTSTIINNLNRIRYQLGQVVGGAWNAAAAMIPVSQKGTASGVASLDANSHVVQQPVYDATEATTLDTLASTSTLVNNLNRLRNQLGIVIGGVGTSWNAAVQMLPLSQKGAASGVASLDASAHVVQTPVHGVRQVAVAMPSTTSDILLSSAYQGGSFQSSSASPTFGPALIPNFTAVTLVTTGGTVLVRLSGTLFNTQASTADWVKFGVQPDGAPGSNLFIGGNNSIPAQTYWSFSFSAPFTGLAAGTHTFVPVYQAGGPGGVNYLQFRLNSSPQVADALSFEVWEYA